MGLSNEDAALSVRELNPGIVGHLSVMTISREMRRWSRKIKEESARERLINEITNEEFGASGGVPPGRAQPPSVLPLPPHLVLDYQDGHVWSDAHIPYHIPELMDISLMRAKSDGIKNLYVPGDLFDLKWASSFIDWGKEGPEQVSKEFDCARKLMDTVMEVFDRVVITPGNHDGGRFRRVSDGVLSFEQLLEMVLGIRLIDYRDKIIVGHNRWFRLEGSPWGNWRLTHPKSARAIPLSLAQRLSEKFHENILTAHQHYLGVSMDKNSYYILCDGGFMQDERLVGYKNEVDTSHSQWTPGYIELVDGWPHIVSSQVFCRQNYKESTPPARIVRKTGSVPNI